MPLTKQSIGILVSRIIGIQLFLTAVAYVPMVGTFSLLYLLLGFSLHLGLSYVFLMHAGLVATFLMSETSTERGSNFKIEQVTTAAFIILGVLVLVKAIPELLATAFSEQFALRGRVLMLVGQKAIELALGAWLVFGSKGIARIIERIRS